MTNKESVFEVLNKLGITEAANLQEKFSEMTDTFLWVALSAVAIILDDVLKRNRIILCKGGDQDGSKWSFYGS